jgi:hypothetical protein
MKAGVRISPRGVEITPVRAAPSVAATLKLMPVAMSAAPLLPLPWAKSGEK